MNRFNEVYLVPTELYDEILHNLVSSSRRNELLALNRRFGIKYSTDGRTGSNVINDVSTDQANPLDASSLESTADTSAAQDETSPSMDTTSADVPVGPKSRRQKLLNLGKKYRISDPAPANDLIEPSLSSQPQQPQQLQQESLTSQALSSIITQTANETAAQILNNTLPTSNLNSYFVENDNYLEFTDEASKLPVKPVQRTYPFLKSTPLKRKFHKDLLPSPYEELLSSKQRVNLLKPKATKRQRKLDVKLEASVIKPVSTAVAINKYRPLPYLTKRGKRTFAESLNFPLVSSPIKVKLRKSKVKKDEDAFLSPPYRKRVKSGDDYLLPLAYSGKRKNPAGVNFVNTRNLKRKTTPPFDDDDSINFLNSSMGFEAFENSLLKNPPFKTSTPKRKKK